MAAYAALENSYEVNTPAWEQENSFLSGGEKEKISHDVAFEGEPSGAGMTPWFAQASGNITHRGHTDLSPGLLAVICQTVRKETINLGQSKVLSSSLAPSDFPPSP